MRKIMEIKICSKEDWWTLLDLYWDEKILKLISNVLGLNSYKNFFQRKTGYSKEIFTLENLIKYKQDRNKKIIDFLLLTFANLDKQHIPEDDYEIILKLWENSNLIE